MTNLTLITLLNRRVFLLSQQSFTFQLIMSQIKDQLFQRDELIDAYVSRSIDGLDLDDCLAILHDYMVKSYEDYSLEEIKEEVNEYYPELLD